MFLRVGSTSGVELYIPFLCRKLIAYLFHAHLNPEMAVDFFFECDFFTGMNCGTATTALPVK